MMDGDGTRVLRPVGGEDRAPGSVGDTFATHLLALDEYSPCFSCGSGLLAWSPSSSGHSGVLTCPQCGAEMATEGASAANYAAEPALCVAA